MIYSNLAQLRSILQLTGKTTPTKHDEELARLQADIALFLIKRQEQCKPGSTLAPFLVLNEIAATAVPLDYNTAMVTGKRRLIILLKDATGAYGAAPKVTVQGLVKGLVITEEVIITEGDGEYLTKTVWDSVTVATHKVTPNADVAAASAKIAVFEGVGELHDIEAQWVAGMFQDERADRYDKESEPPEAHPWIMAAMKRFEIFIKEHCEGKQKGRQPSRVVGRSVL